MSVTDLVTLLGIVRSTIIAMAQHWQTNRLKFFEYRIQVVNTLHSIYRAVEANLELVSQRASDDKPFGSIFLVALMNNSVMQDCQRSIGEPEFQNKFLLKRNEIERIADRSRFLFNKREARYCIEFVDSYFRCLIEEYKMQCLLESIIKTNKELNLRAMIKCQRYAEVERIQSGNDQAIKNQSKMIQKACRTLLSSYKQFEEKNVIKNMERKLRLFLPRKKIAP